MALLHKATLIKAITIVHLYVMDIGHSVCHQGCVSVLHVIYKVIHLEFRLIQVYIRSIT